MGEINTFPQRTAQLIRALGGRRPVPQLVLEQTGNKIPLDLEERFSVWGSDKHLNGYASLYASLLADVLASQDSEIHLLEIGLGSRNPRIPSTMAFGNFQSGGSLRALVSLDSRIRGVGIDVDQECLFSENRITTRLASQLDSNSLEAVAHEFRDSRFSLIIDDGLHFFGANFNSLEVFFPLLRDGGFYVVEDIPTRSLPIWELIATALPDTSVRWNFWSGNPGANCFVLQKLEKD